MKQAKHISVADAETERKFFDEDTVALTIPLSGMGVSENMIYEMAFKGGYISLHQHHNWKGGVEERYQGSVIFQFNDVKILVRNYWDNLTIFALHDDGYLDSNYVMNRWGTNAPELMFTKPCNGVDLKAVQEATGMSFDGMTYEEQDTLKPNFR